MLEPLIRIDLQKRKSTTYAFEIFFLIFLQKTEMSETLEGSYDALPEDFLKLVAM
jgi:hypothetical protein